MKNPFHKQQSNEQKTSFHDLSRSEKAGYIWEYYKYYMLAAVIVVIIIVSIVHTYRSNNYDTVFTCIVVDGKITGADEADDALTTGFGSYLGIDGVKKRVSFQYNYTLKDEAMDQDAMLSRSKIVVLSSTHSMDGLLTNKDYITYFSTDDESFLVDLREILTSDELEKIGDDHIIYFETSDGTRIPVAVDLTGTKVKTDTDLTLDNPCYGVVTTAANPDNAVAFIRYAFGL